MTRISKSLYLTAAAFAGLFEATSFAQQDMNNTSAVASSQLPHVVELDIAPIIANAVKNSHGIGLGGEYALTDQISLTAGISSLELALPGYVKERMETKDGLGMTDLSVLKASVGSRYYFSSGRSDSWYAGGVVQAMKHTTKWAYHEASLEDSNNAIAAGGDFGHRAFFKSGLTTRLGVKALYNLTNDREVKAVDDDKSNEEGRRLLKDRHKDFNLSLNAAVGYAF